MAQLVFNALLFDSQCTPDALPEFAPDPFPADCGLTADQKSDLGKDSIWVGIMDTPAKVMEHWRILNAQRAQEAQRVAAETAKDPVERAKRQAARGHHANVVNDARIAWRQAVVERDNACAHHDRVVATLHAEFKRLKDMKVI